MKTTIALLFALSLAIAPVSFADNCGKEGCGKGKASCEEGGKKKDCDKKKKGCEKSCEEKAEQ